MKPVILMRPSLAEEQEESIAKRYFDVYRQRSDVPSGSLVIGRYSVLPYYDELQADMQHNGSQMINTYRQHQWIADLSQWYQDFESITPKTWFRLEHLPDDGGPFVLKGATNSKKFQWNTHMFAANKQEAGKVYSRLTQDGLVGDQDIYIRKYVPLRKLEEGLNGLPICEEYRLFFLDRQLVAGGFYWLSHIDDFTPSQVASLTPDNVPESFLEAIRGCLGTRARFVVVDVARTETGEWIVVELNDGQMSGLSCVDPDYLYSRISRILK
jgi:hypothetical protein